MLALFIKGGIKMRTYSGKFGVVLFLDVPSVRKCVELNEVYSHESWAENRIKLDVNHNQPHVTLYHAVFANLPHDVVVDTVDGIRNHLRMVLPFTHIQDFGGKFLFWQIDRKYLNDKPHAIALRLSTYLDRSAVSAASKEQLKLSGAEEAHLNRYGHPLVGQLWQPHVTLGYFPNGINPVYVEENYYAWAYSVAFVEMGEFGTVKTIIYSP
jgi:hypothetical protein